jgi:predicted TIM-barrel fold metal-dependent hydrolase
MSSKRLEGRLEPILEPDLPIIDSHNHLFDRPAMRYMLDDYLADAGAGHRIVASVYVETQAFERSDGPPVLRPLGEVEFANGMGAMAASGAYGACRACAAIVGYADLRYGDAVGELLDRAMMLAPERFRGVRQVTIEHPSETPFRFMTNRPPSGVLSHPEFHRGMRQLEIRGLRFDAAIFHNQLGDLAALADAFPGLPLVLNHLGIAMGMDMGAAERADVFASWKHGMRELARRKNVYCKVGGLGMPFWGFGFEQRGEPIGYLELATAWRPYIETAIEAFGVERCMMESNFPPDGRSCGFVPLFNALKHVVRACNAEEKAALFHRTAIQFYNLNLDPSVLTDLRPKLA